MATISEVRLPEPLVLRDVPYKLYLRLRGIHANRHMRMTYHDGTLEIMTLRHLYHEVPSRRLGLIVLVVCSELNILWHGAGSATFHRGGDGPLKGKGKEPDQSFYFGDEARLVAVANIDRFDFEAGDPPPDLWIEVDNRSSSRGKLPVYAALGVPEVWRYRSRKKTLAFLRLVDGSYEPVERSLALPMLTPALVLHALSLGEGVSESSWFGRLRDWVRETLAAGAG